MSTFMPRAFVLGVALMLTLGDCGLLLGDPG